MEKNTVDIISAVCQIIGAIGSLATFGAFLFLFRRDKDKQEQIDNLRKLRELEETKFALSVRPEVRPAGGHSDGEHNFFLNFVTDRHQAIIESIVIKNSDVDFDESKFPIQASPGSNFEILCTPKFRRMRNDCNYNFYLNYSDQLGNLIKLEIQGKFLNHHVIGIPVRV